MYSDLGDYPTALRYFQDALDHLPDNDDNLYFRGVVLSQIGRLLSELRLWSKSQPYLVESISISKSTKDNLGAAYDLELLGITCMETGNLNKADSIFNEAVKMAAKVSSVDSANICVYLADVQYRLGNIDAALGIVRKLPAQVEQSFIFGFWIRRLRPESLPGFPAPALQPAVRKSCVPTGSRP